MAKIFYNENELLFSEIPENEQFIDVSGKGYGRLTVLGFAGQNKDKRAHWFCKCECGKITRVYSLALRNGMTSSCGCLNVEKIKMCNTIHGEARQHNETPEYHAWRSLLSRCNNPKNPKFSYYGGRGIKVCDRWLNIDFFIDDMGRRPSSEYSIDRIDNDGNYEPSNCRWATRKEQANNKSSNVYLTYNGETKTIAQFSKDFEMHKNTLSSRIFVLGWPIEKALTTPVKFKN